MLGIVAHIQGHRYEVFAVSSATGIPQEGDCFDANAVYCREVVANGKTVAVTEIDGTPGMRLHPLYDTIPCEVYIAAPIVVDGQIWGSINYTSLEVRETRFSASDIAYIEGQAETIAAALSIAE